MLYRLQKKDIPKAGTVLSDAFQDDPVWNKIFEGESRIEWKLNACFETPVRYCYRYGEVYAISQNLEGVAAWVPGDLADMTIWRMIRSGAILSGMRMGVKAGKRMKPVLDPLQKDRKENMKGRPFIYLIIIGVATEFQGQGCGGKMLRKLIDKSEKTGTFIYLETEIEDYVKMYEKFGFQLIKQITLPVINLPMWEMAREPGT